MTDSTIRREVTGGLWVLTLNRPARRNALDTAMRAELTAALREAADHARCVVLTGAGGAFCSGQDLSDRTDLAGHDAERTLAEEYLPLLRAVADCPAPVIAAVGGAAAGAGANLALGCDVVIAAESAVFLQAFTRIGLLPDAGGTYWLPRQVGAARAMGAALFAEPVTARQAADWGMIWEAVPDDAFEAHWRARAEALAAGPSVALAAVKQALRASAANGFEDQLALEGRLQGRCAATGDFREGVAAFLDKRAPRFTGR